jgi:hypothetical protein
MDMKLLGFIFQSDKVGINTLQRSWEDEMQKVKWFDFCV